MSEVISFLRQIHPNWLEDEKPASVAFLPSDKDKDKLSGYDGTRVEPKDSYEHYTQTLGLKSAAVFGIAKDECASVDLSIESSPLEDHPYHMHIDFTPLTSKGKKKSAAKKLRDFAVQRGALYLSVA